MVIVLIELYVLFGFTNKLSIKNVNLQNILLFALAIQAIILAIYRINLWSIGREVYYSDAEVYWNHTKILLNGGRIIGYGDQVGYAYFCWIIQLLSPFHSVIWNNISNILLVNVSVILIDDIFEKSGVIAENIKSFSRICLYNPLIIYSLSRNLKDALFLFIVILIFYLYTLIKWNKKWICLLPIALLTVAIATIRPWGFLVMPILGIDGLLSSEFGNKGMRMVIGITIFAAFIVILRVTSLWNHVVLWEPIVVGNAESLSVSELIKAPLKILTGPGPYRSILGNTYFVFTTASGNVLCALGATFWWLNLSAYCENIRSFKLNSKNLSFILICVLFIAIYSMQYGGSLELRFRGVIYILFSASYFSCLTKPLKISAISALSFLIIASVGTIFSL